MSIIFVISSANGRRIEGEPIGSAQSNVPLTHGGPTQCWVLLEFGVKKPAVVISSSFRRTALMVAPNPLMVTLVIQKMASSIPENAIAMRLLEQNCLFFLGERNVILPFPCQ